MKEADIKKAKAPEFVYLDVSSRKRTMTQSFDEVDSFTAHTNSIVGFTKYIREDLVETDKPTKSE